MSVDEFLIFLLDDEHIDDIVSLYIYTLYVSKIYICAYTFVSCISCVCVMV